MTKVFVSGSIRIKVLHSDIKHQLQQLMAANIDILIGDAPGVDTSVQEYLHHWGYRHITVYGIGEMPRNNVGQWPTIGVEPTGKPGSREFFTAKDKKMVADCDSGILIWDGKSRGTKRNAVQLLQLDKPALVYLTSAEEFCEIRSVDELERLRLPVFR